MLGRRRWGSEPGRCASSRPGSGLKELSGGTAHWEFEASAEESVLEDGTVCRAVGALGWLMAFWPVITVPSARPAEM